MARFLWSIKFPGMGYPFFFVCLVVAFTVVILSSPGYSQSREEVIQRMQAVYESMDTLRAAFEQETRVRSARKVIREEGTVYYLRPGLMRWDYSVPKEKRLYLSSKKSWLFLPQDKIVYVKENGIFSSNIIARFITGAGRIEEDFTINFEGQEGEIKLTLRPKEKSPAVKAMKITVSPKTFVVTSCRYTDDYGNEVYIRFKSIELNAPLEQKLFFFNPPQGVTVLPMQ